MLTTSTISMSLGSDLASARQISPDRADTSTISFAESFDKSVPTLKGEISLQLDNGKKVKSERAARNIVSSIKVGGGDSDDVKMKANASGEVEIQDKYQNTNNSIVSKNATMGTKTGETFSDNDKLHEDVLMAIQARITTSQLPDENLKDVEQNPTPEGVDGVTQGSDNQADAAKIEVSASAAPAVLDNGMTAAVQNKREILISNKNVIPSKKMTKDNDGIVKNVKLSKLEDKTQKNGEQVGEVVEAGQITNIFGLAIQANRQHDSNIGQDDLLSSPDFEAPGRSIDMDPMLVTKLGHKTRDPEKIDDDGTKVAVPSIDDSSLQKVGTDLSKAGLFPISMVDGDSAKVQSAVIAGETIGSTHTESGMVVTAFGGTSGVVAAQIIVPKALTPEANSHTANTHADSVIDASGVIEVTHQTLMATPTSLEVGVANGTHGWLKIRAEMTSGGVNASLSPATSSGQEMLHRELPSLTAYLQSERVLVNTVVLQPAVIPPPNFQQLAAGTNDGGRGQTPQSDGQGGQQNRQGAAGAGENPLERDGIYRDAVEDRLLPLASYAGGGRWLNVRA